MDTVIVSFRADNDDSVEWEAVVDTLDPIRALIDQDEEPPVPDFADCTLFDSSYGSTGNRHEFIIDYGLDDGASLDPVQVEATLRDFLATVYGMRVQAFAPLQA